MLSKSSGYAVRAAIFLATKRHTQIRYGVKEISIQLQAPSHYVAKILQQLARLKLIDSFKGPKGGFAASKATLNCSILTIVEAVEGKNTLNQCTLGLKECDHKNPCPIHFDVKEHRDSIKQQLASKKIVDLAERVSHEKQVLA